jgi:hypothetical protein
MNRSIFREQLIDLRGAIYNPGQQVEVNVNGQWRPAQIQNLESYTVRNFFTREITNRPPNQVFPEGGNPNANGENTNLIPGRSVLFQGPDQETRVPGTIISKNYIVQIDGRTENVPNSRLRRASGQPQATAQPQAAERLGNEEFLRQMREIAANPNVPPRPAATPGPRAGVAFEVHNAFDDFKANKWDKFMEIINRTTGTNTNFRNRNAPLQPLIDYVNTSESFNENKESSSPEDKAEMIRKKADIIEKINRIFTQIQGYSNYNANIDNITNCIQYVLMQPPEFIDAYINTFVVDCFKAYNSSSREESCVKGMYERVYLAFRDTASTLCLDQIQGVSAASLCKPDYIEIYDCFYETLPQALLNDFSKEWYEERGGDEALGSLSPEARIEDFVSFVRGRMNDDARFAKAEASIRRYANKEINILFGGKRRSSRNKRSVRKTHKKRSVRKNRKTIKNRKNKTVKKRSDSKKRNVKKY